MHIIIEIFFFFLLVYNREQIALWSDVHILGYMLNDKYQRDPVAWSNLQCERWYEERQKEPLYDFEQDLYPCPCNLSQAIADRGRWKPAPFCDISKAGMQDRNDYCRYREDILHCVINIIHRWILFYVLQPGSLPVLSGGPVAFQSCPIAVIHLQKDFVVNLKVKCFII